jgi:hypothetical protein
VRPAAFALVLLTALLVAPAAHGATCPGRTLYHRHGIRVTTHTEYYESPRRYEHDTFYACRAGRRWVIEKGDAYAEESLRSISLRGRRLGFVMVYDADVYAVYAGWTDIRTHRTRLGLISNLEDAGKPRVPTKWLDYAIAPDGAIAVLGSAGGTRGRQEVALLEPASRKRGFRPCRSVMTLSEGGLKRGSLRITRTEISVARLDGTRLTFDR